MSESSEDYNVIVNNFLDCNREWQRVPEVVYLTIKAMFQHSELLQQKLLSQKQLMTEQFIKLRELQVELRSRAQQSQSMNQIEQILNYQQNGFRKNKKHSQKVLGSKFEMKYQSSRSKKGQDSFSNFKSPNKSMEGDRVERGSDGLFEEIKKVAESVVEQKTEELMKQIHPLHKLKDQFPKIVEQSQCTLSKSFLVFKEDIEGVVESKLRDNQKQISNKLQSQRNNIKNLVEETAKENEKIWVQLDSIQARVSGVVEDSKFSSSNINYLKEQKVCVEKERKKQINEENKTIVHGGLQSNLNKQLMQFKVNVMKEMALFLKLSDIQPIFKKYQTEMGEKIKKVSKNVGQLEKEMSVQKKELLSKNQPKIVIPNIKQVEKDKSSEESLKAIQQSLLSVQNYFKEKLKSFRKQLTLQMEKNVRQVQEELMKELRQEIQFREKSLCEVVQMNCDKVISLQEKFFASGEYVGLQKSLEKLSEQMILARYLHFGQRLCKQFVEWEKEIYTSMEENFSWKTGSSHVTVQAAGLYRVQVGLYLDNETDRIQAFLMLNGERISELKPKEVPANSKAIARGSLFNEAILLPAKSKIAIKLDLPFLGQSYLQIHKL